VQIRSAIVAVTTFRKSHAHKQTTVMILMPAPHICFSINNSRYMAIVMVSHRFECEAQLTAGIALAIEGIAFASVQSTYRVQEKRMHLISNSSRPLQNLSIVQTE
jgi:hypothetical protein